MVIWCALGKGVHNEFRPFSDCTATCNVLTDDSDCTAIETSEFILKPFGSFIPDDQDLEHCTEAVIHSFQPWSNYTVLLPLPQAMCHTWECIVPRVINRHSTILSNCLITRLWILMMC